MGFIAGSGVGKKCPDREWMTPGAQTAECCCGWLMGERGREVKEFIPEILMSKGERDEEKATLYWCVVGRDSRTRLGAV